MSNLQAEEIKYLAGLIVSIYEGNIPSLSEHELERIENLIYEGDNDE